MHVQQRVLDRLWVAVIVGLGCCALASRPAWADRPPADLQAGRAAYEQQCARCHGAAGAGDGRDAKRFLPRPRDFTSGTYKIRTTISGTAPTDEDLMRSLTHGLAGSGMPDWKHLDEATRWQLVHYLKSLSAVFNDASPEPVALGQDPGARGADPARGKHVYETLGCAACHGAQGRANGPSAATLTDNWGGPIRAANLTQGWNYRGGSDARAIVTRMLTGIDGTPMPSYAEAVTPEEAWQLAYYVRSLHEPANWGVIAHAPKAEALPEAPDDPRWAAAPSWTVSLRPAPGSAGEIATPPTVNAVMVQALHDDSAVALRVAWDDPTESRQEPADRLAVVLRPRGVDGDVVTLQAWPLHASPPLDVCLWSSRDGGVAYERLSRNYDSALKRNGNGHTLALDSQARYDDGRWSVVLRRPLTVAKWSDAADLTPGPFDPIAFVVWDGGNPGQRVVSMWVDLALEGEAAPHQHAAASQAAGDGPALAAAARGWAWPASGAVLIVALALVFRT